MESLAGITILSKLSRNASLLSTRERTVSLCSPIPPVNTRPSNFFSSDGNICAMPSETLVQNISNASSADSSPLAAASSMYKSVGGNSKRKQKKGRNKWNTYRFASYHGLSQTHPKVRSRDVTYDRYRSHSYPWCCEDRTQYSDRYYHTLFPSLILPVV